MRWFLVLLMALASVTSQVNLKLTSARLPLSYAQAVELGLGNAVTLLLRAGSLAGIALLLTWYTYKYFGFLELFVASSLTYILAVLVGRMVFEEPITWTRIGGVALVACGVGLFFVK
ncbi:MAG TPA: hypothetical protein VKY73_23695 [Polyangiaceae bacterium]|nr:hypothetical protein [Polyangiaceae bacterium]